MAEAVEEPKINGNGSDSEEDDPPPGEGLSEEIFEVETILEHLKDADNVMFYKVRWKNYGPADDSWEPAENLETSAGKAIETYWEEWNANPEKHKKAKKTTPKKANSASKKASGRRGRSAKGISRSKSRTKSPKDDEPEEEPEKSESEKSSSDDEDYGNDDKKKKSRPVSKGALKSFDTPKKPKRGEAPMNSARRQAMEHRQSWLFDNASDSDDDEPKEENEGNTESNEKTEEQQPESSDKSKRTKKDEQKRRRDESDGESETYTSKERRSKETIQPEIEENDVDEPRTKRGRKEKELRSPTPPKPSTSGSAEPTNVEYINNDLESRKLPPIKIKLGANPKTSIKQKEKTTSDILYYNKFPKHRPLSEIQDLKEIDIVEGIMISPQGGWHVFVRDVTGALCMLTAEEAYERCGWTLVQYLLARAKFS